MTARIVDVIAVPFDGYGRLGHQAAAAASYEAAGLMAHASLELRATPTMRLPAFSTSRGPLTGLLNEAALFAAIDAAADAVSTSLSAGRFPLVVGGDCSILLGTFAGAHAVDDSFGLLFIDGHEDTTPLDVVEDGEAANAELGVLLGTTGRIPSFPRPSLRGTLLPNRLAAVGMRDHRFRREANVGSVRDLGAFHRSARDVRDDPARVARQAVMHLAGRPWWMHVDLDVLDPSELPATLVPGETEQERGGLSWAQLTSLMTTAAASDRCRGLSIAIYDPEQDPARRYAPAIVDLTHRTLAATHISEPEPVVP